MVLDKRNPPHGKRNIYCSMHYGGSSSHPGLYWTTMLFKWPICLTCTEYSRGVDQAFQFGFFISCTRTFQNICAVLMPMPVHMGTSGMASQGGYHSVLHDGKQGNRIQMRPVLTQTHYHRQNRRKSSVGCQSGTRLRTACGAHRQNPQWNVQ